MANEKGVWRTIGGRRVFIKEGQDLASAMKESGKFKSASKGTAKKESTQSVTGEKSNHKEGENIPELPKNLTNYLDTHKGMDEFPTKVVNGEKLFSISQEEHDMLQNYIDKVDSIPEETWRKWGDKEALDISTRVNNAERVLRNSVIDNKASNEKFEVSDLDKKGDKLTKEATGEKKLEAYRVNEDGKKEMYERTLGDDERGYWTKENGRRVFKENPNYKGEKTSIEKDNQKSLEQQYADDLHNGKTKGTYKQWLDKKNGKTDFTREELNNLERIGEKKVGIKEDDIGKTPYEKGEKYRNSIIETAKNSKEDNVTLDTETGKVATFDKGYSVSFQQSSDNYDDKEYYEKVEECRNKCDGKLYAGKYGGDAEASFHTDDIETAKELMYKYNQESIYDWKHETLIMNDKYDSSSNKTNYEAEKSTNDIMNEKIRSRGKAEDDLPKHVEIKSQGTSNRKEVSENIQAHILEHYDSPEDFIEQMDAYDWKPTMWHRGEALAEDGFYEIYYEDQRKFLDGLKINPKGKNFSDDRVFQTYKSLIGRESAKLYDRIQKNSYKKYMKAHPLSKMSFEEFKNMRGGK